MLENQASQQESTRNDKADSTDELGDTEGTDVEAVGTQSFDKHTSEAVPAEVHKGVLTVEFFLFIEGGNDDKAENVPKGFVEEGGVVIKHLPTRIFRNNTHAQKIQRAGFRDLIAKRFPIGKVAPTANGLRKHYTRADHVQYTKNVELFDKTHDHNGDRPRNDATVYGKSTVSNGEHITDAVILIQFGQDIIQTSAAHPEKDDKDGEIQQVIHLDALIFGAEIGVEHSGQNPHHDDHAVPVNIHPERRKSYAGKGKFFNTQTGKSYSCHMHSITPLFVKSPPRQSPTGHIARE